MEKSNKRATIVSYYRWWDTRLKYYGAWLNEHGYKVNYISADFDHITKTYGGGEKLPSCGRYVHVPSYKSNLSVKRLASNMIFAYRVKRILNRYPAEVVVCLLPANSLGKELASYKKKHMDSVLIFDVLDMWPESLPFNGVKRIAFPLLAAWKKLRTKGLAIADGVICECALFHEMLKKDIKNKAYVLYLQNGKAYDKKPCIADKGSKLNFLYVGSINNIVDISGITKLLAKVNKERSVKLTIIGCGSSENEFAESLKREGIEVDFKGAVFEEAAKHEIMKNCHFGINMMKDSVCVGLTTKSMDYLKEGLPLVNSIPHDTRALVEEYHAGFNVLPDIDETARRLIKLDDNEYRELKEGAGKLFFEKFSIEIFEKKVDEIFTELVYEQS